MPSPVFLKTIEGHRPGEQLLKNGLFLLGIATHPVQDKHGHNDYYYDLRVFDNLFTLLISSVIPGILEDRVTETYDLCLYGDKVMTYEHFDDVIKSRDETYHILGRFYKEYKDVIDRR
ncbi:MAG: hypothetical protein FWF08_01460 [Oscillospiraceae bacterium]|nr:hypothetical protein [Oscillospiraceae bacterium]